MLHALIAAVSIALSGNIPVPDPGTPAPPTMVFNAQGQKSKAAITPTTGYSWQGEAWRPGVTYMTQPIPGGPGYQNAHTHHGG